MKSLGRRADHDAIIARLHRLRPDTPRRWGRMSAPQMVCHLTDAFRSLLGERPTSTPSRTPGMLGRTLVRWIALYSPFLWPRGIRTRPEIDSQLGGTPPSSHFDDDVAALEAAAARFLSAGEHGPRKPHFMFGQLSEAEWQRWAYLHMDHHLRQFGL
jgi:hypothetical protein